MRNYYTSIYSTITTGQRQDAGKKHNYPKHRKAAQRAYKQSFDTNPDLAMSKTDQESVCAVRTSAGLPCRNCKYYQHKYCLYDQGLIIE